MSKILRIPAFVSVFALFVSLFPAIVSAQTTAVLLPQPKQQFTDSIGRPLVFGKVCTFSAGTNTPLASFTDSTGGTQATNPIVLDAAGRASVWISASLYKIVAYAAGGDSNCPNSGVQQWSVDNVGILTGSSATVSFIPTSNGVLNLGDATHRWNSFIATESVTTSFTANKIDGVIIVDGATYMTVQAGITATP